MSVDDVDAVNDEPKKNGEVGLVGSILFFSAHVARIGDCALILSLCR